MNSGWLCGMLQLPTHMRRGHTSYTSRKATPAGSGGSRTSLSPRPHSPPSPCRRHTPRTTCPVTPNALKSSACTPLSAVQVIIRVSCFSLAKADVPGALGCEPRPMSTFACNHYQSDPAVSVLHFYHPPMKVNYTWLEWLSVAEQCHLPSVLAGCPREPTAGCRIVPVQAWL